MALNGANRGKPHEIKRCGLSRGAYSQSYPQVLWKAQKVLMKPGLSVFLLNFSRLRGAVAHKTLPLDFYII
jgi:hypothetical protein